MDDDECIHGLHPGTCSICRARAAPKPLRPVPTSRPASSRPASVRAAASRPAATRPSTRAAPVHLAGRKEYFGAGARGVWWIDQTGRAEGVVAAVRPSTGSVPASSRNVGEIRADDVTLHVVAGELRAVGVASSDGRATSGPPPGWLAEVRVVALVRPIELDELPAALKPGPPHPFTNQGFLQAGTCYPFPPTVAADLATRFADRFPPEHPLLPRPG